MASPENVSVRDLLNRYMDTGQTVCIQNIPDTASPDTLICFMEVILKSEVIATCNPLPELKDWCIAVMDKPVTDYGTLTKSLQERKLNDSVLILLPLGSAKGVFIRRVPKEVSDEFLQLYFETTRSGGEEGCVKDVRCCRCCPNRLVVVVIDNIVVVKRILNKTSHPSLGKHHLNLEPYFPVIHDEMFKRHSEGHSESTRNLDARSLSYLRTEKSLDPRQVWQQIYSRKEDQSQERTYIHDESHTKGLKENASERNSQPYIRPNRLSPFNPQLNVKGTNPVLHKDTQPFQYNKPRLRIFTDDDEIKFSPSIETECQNNPKPQSNFDMAQNTTFRTTESICKQNDDPTVETNLPNAMKSLMEINTDGASISRSVTNTPVKGARPSSCSKRPTKFETENNDNVGMKPRTRCQSIEDDTSNCDAKAQGKPSVINRRSRPKRPSIPKQSSLEGTPGDKARIDLQKTDIVLLKINGFTRRCSDCKVTLMENKGCVEFEGDVEALRKAQIKMYETLQSAERVAKNLPKHHVQYIQESQGYLRTQLTKRKIGAALKIDIDQSTVQCLAFTVQQAEKGLEFVTEELVSKHITIREGQTHYFEGEEWDKIVKQLQTHAAVTVVKDENIVDILAYNERSVYMARQKIIQYLKDSRPKEKAEIELNGATARCFKRYFLEDLKSSIRKQNGNVKWFSESPASLKIVVEGEPSLYDAVQDKVKQVWHEKVDFVSITKDVQELWLLMKGLGSHQTKDFVLKFEREHSCFVEMCKEGEVSLPVLSVQRSEREVSDVHSREVLDVHSREEEFDQAVTTNQSLDIPDEFKLDMTEDEALQVALMESMLEPTHHGVVYESSQPGRESAFHINYESLTTPKPNFYGPAYEMPRSLQAGSLERNDLASGARRLQDLKQSSRKFGSTIVTVKLGSIATDTISSRPIESVAKVNILSPTRDIQKESVVSKAFVKAGGQELVQNYESAKNQISSGVVVTQGCSALKSDFVFHVTLKKNSQSPQMVITEVMEDCFQLCAVYGCTCIAFPPLGIGRLYKYDSSVVAENMIKCIHTQAQTSTLKEIVIVIFEKEEEIFNLFESELNSAQLGKATAPMAMFASSPYLPVSSLATGSPFLSRPKPAPRQAALKPSLMRVNMSGINLYPNPTMPSQLSNVARSSAKTNYSSGLKQTSTPGPYTLKTGTSPTVPSYRDSRSSDRCRQDIQNRRTDYKTPRKRSPPESPVTKFKVKVFSRDKPSCEEARNELSKQLKSRFLHEIKLERRGKISADCKKKIRDTLKKFGVKSFQVTGTKDYVIKGEERSVTEAFAEILNIILKFKDTEPSFESRRTRRRDLRSKPNEYVRHMALEHEPEVPGYWKNWKSGSPIKTALTAFKTLTKNYVTITLTENDTVYREIINLINRTWDGSIVGHGKDAKGLEMLNYRSIRVTKIRRVENLQLFDKYLNRRKHIFIDTHRREKTSCTPIAKLPRSNGSAQTEELQRCHVFEDELCSEVNEHFFFHGTTPDTIDVICDGGLDSRLGSQQAMYGPGIYGADSSTKADQYADPKDKRTKDGKKMILMRMVLGESFLCTDHDPHKYRRPPCMNTSCCRDDCKDKSHGKFDSVIGQSGRLFREFVVYYPDQCYPEYIISYDRV